jgi:DNA-binding transcriptional regulator YhcF (GntR family)
MAWWVTIMSDAPTFGSSRMEQDYLAASRELLQLGYNLTITSGGRTKEEDERIKKKYGFSGGKEHIELRALDIIVNGQQAFKPGTHLPTEKGLANAKAIQGVMAKHGFNWAGEKDIVHFSYTGQGQVVSVDNPNQQKGKKQSISNEFFSQFGKLQANLDKIDTLPEKKIKEMANFLIKAGKHT